MEFGRLVDRLYTRKGIAVISALAIAGFGCGYAIGELTSPDPYVLPAATETVLPTQPNIPIGPLEPIPDIPDLP